MKKIAVFLLAIVIVLSNTSFGQCAMCKATAEAGQENEIEFGRNINYGILFLMIIPYIILFLLFRKQIFRLYQQFVRKKTNV
jgi:ABC-type glycerol-3-phosphate transport system permease component